MTILSLLKIICVLLAVVIGQTNAEQPVANEMLNAVNYYRTQLGMGRLRLNAALVSIATTHTQVMAETETQTHMGSAPSEAANYDRFLNSGIPAVSFGENTAHGPTSVGDVVLEWMADTKIGNKANILSPDFTHMGAAQAQDSTGAFFWTLDFAGIPAAVNPQGNTPADGCAPT